MAAHRGVSAVEAEGYAVALAHVAEEVALRIPLLADHADPLERWPVGMPPCGKGFAHPRIERFLRRLPWPGDDQVELSEGHRLVNRRGGFMVAECREERAPRSGVTRADTGEKRDTVGASQPEVG